MKYALLAFVCLETAAADTIYLRSAQGEEQLLARDVIVTTTTQWSEGRGLAAVSFFYWHPRKQILVEDTRSATEGESLRVEKSKADERQRILSSIFNAGIHAVVTGVTGEVREVFCLRNDYYYGYATTRRAPDDDVTLRVIPSGTNEVKSFPFSDLSQVEFTGKDRMKVRFKDGRGLDGTFYRAPDHYVQLEGIDKTGKSLTMRWEDVMRLEFRPGNTLR